MALELPEQLKPGLCGSAGIIVGPEHTAPHIGSGKVKVLATPVMVNLMEAAALQAVEHLMPDGHQTVGIHLDVSHHAATPVGMGARARAELTGINGRTLRFRVVAEDDKEQIGEGTHERIIINVARFDRRAQDKLSAASRTAES